jgi:hypothetical protein
MSKFAEARQKIIDLALSSVLTEITTLATVEGVATSSYENENILWKISSIHEDILDIQALE